MRIAYLLRAGFMFFVALLFVPAPTPYAENGTTRILFFSPTTEGNTYWPQVFGILRAAAEDLGVEFIPHEFPVEDRYAKHTEGVEILEAAGDVDGAVFSVAFGQTGPLLEVAARRDIPVFIQGPLFEQELPDLGYEPRRIYENWVGLFVQDEFEKGRRLGELLIEQARDAAETENAGVVEVVGIGGDETWYGSQRRADGLRAAVRDHSRVRLKQIVPTQWTEAEGQRIAAGLLGRYPNTSIIWAASDQLAIGAVRAVEEAGLTVGEDVFIGGLDLSSRGLQYVDQGRLSATVSAPLLSYAEILVYLYDYIHGSDFAPEAGTEIRLDTHAATRETAGQYRRLYESVDEIDFRHFSRAVGSDWNGYDFSLDAYLTATER